MGRLVASRWTGENTDKPSAVPDTTLDNEDREDPKGRNNEEYEGYASETDDDNNKYDDDKRTLRRLATDFFVSGTILYK